jgi:hypothetical protein
LPPKVSETSKKFILELSGITVPVNEHPELEPATLPVELMVIFVVIPSSNVPVQVPEIEESDAGV